MEQSKGEGNPFLMTKDEDNDTLCKITGSHKSNFLSRLKSRSVPDIYLYDDIVYQLTNWDVMTKEEKKECSNYHNYLRTYIVKTYFANTKHEKNFSTSVPHTKKQTEKKKEQ